jgi:hypothetical protein
MAELIVGGALLRVTQNFIGELRLFELLVRIAPWVTIGVILHGEPSVGLLDIGFTGVPTDPKNLIVVAFGHRLICSSPSPGHPAIKKKKRASP